MSNRGDGHRRSWLKWIFLLLFILVSPWIGIFIDVRILFPPSPDVHGHGIPVFTFLMPVFAILITIITAIISGIVALVRKARKKGAKQYEYLKIYLQGRDAQSPVVIFHEIDLAAGRCSLRCIYVYGNGYAECFANNGIYTPIPPIEAINMPFQRSVNITTAQEFETVWRRRRL